MVSLGPCRYRVIVSRCSRSLYLGVVVGEQAVACRRVDEGHALGAIAGGRITDVRVAPVAPRRGREVLVHAARHAAVLMVARTEWAPPSTTVSARSRWSMELSLPTTRLPSTSTTRPPPDLPYPVIGWFLAGLFLLDAAVVVVTAIRPPGEAGPTRRAFVVTLFPHLVMDIAMTVMLVAALTTPGRDGFTAATTTGL
ncbi:DUF5134 domain-containing protein [Nocardia sp. NPDC057455]|uniref:DUF5134 domain-containing protein n=1 Tax=Nocardia sp. NPDC057455 TaxID=3346138 RepID=UPI00366AE950